MLLVVLRTYSSAIELHKLIRQGLDQLFDFFLH
jgi:hypothetical protein